MTEGTEIQRRADFSAIRYAQCWEDAAILVRALEVSGRDCLSIGSAGDNSFALLAGGARQVTAVELNPAQVACIELRRAAYLSLEHPELLELIGARRSERRAELYGRCRAGLPPAIRGFWDNRPAAIRNGIGNAGKFEGYFRLFRERVLPLAHPRTRVAALLEARDRAGREAFYESRWNNRRWRWLFRLFFSRPLMGRLGRDPEFFKYVEGRVSARILERTRHALVELEPARNPYLHWILRGEFGETLPPALEAGAFPRIRAALTEGRFRVVTAPLEEWLAREPATRYDAFNLSDIFEYMSGDAHAALLEKIAAAARPGARLAYWNMLAPRSRPAALAGCLRPLDSLAAELFRQDRAFFYSRFVVEEVPA